MQVTEAARERVHCLIEEGRQVALAVVVLPVPEGNVDGRGDRGRGDLKLQVIGGKVALAGNGRGSMPGTGLLHLKETGPQFRHRAEQALPGEELAGITVVKAGDDLADDGADAFGDRFVVRARFKQFDGERVVLVPENFYINVPICLATLLATRRVQMPDTKRPGVTRLDLLGLILLSPALAALVYGLAQAGTHGSFTDPHVLAPLGAGAALLLGFAVHALRARTEPLIDLRLFRARSFAGASAAVFFFSMAMLGTALLIPLYYQQARGQDALHAGLLLAPQGVGLAVALVIASRLTDRIGPRPIMLAGLGLTALATLAYTRVGADTSLLWLSAVLVVGGLGIGAALVPALAGAYHGLTTEAVPRATGAIRSVQQLGGSFGIAILAVVLQQQISATAEPDPASVAAAYGHTFWWALAFTALALGPTLLLPRTPAGRGESSGGRNPAA